MSESPMSESPSYTVNGRETALPEPKPVQALLEELGLSGKRVAVMVNDEIVGKSGRAERMIHEGDHVEIIHMVGGG